MQTVETLSGRHVLWRLIWVCTVCLCPTERTLGIYGLSIVPKGKSQHKTVFGPALEILVPIAQVLSEGSGGTVHPPSLASAFAARLDIVWK